MARHFSKHYTVENARALLPQVRGWLGRLDELRKELKPIEKKVQGMVGRGNDMGGELVSRLVRALADCQDILSEFERREIQVKDLDRGLIDFPSLREGKEILLCWEKDEEDIEFWHDLESGYAGRERL